MERPSSISSPITPAEDDEVPQDYRVPVAPDESWLAARLRRHASELVRLAAPIVASRTGFLLLVMADTVMVGRYSPQELAYQAMGLTPFMPMLITSLGLIMGTLVMTAHAVGRDDPAACGAVWRRGLVYAVVLGALAVIASQFGEPLLLALGQAPDLAGGGGSYLAVIGLGLPGMLIFLATAFFLEGIKRPLPGMFVMIAANVLNVALNWLLIEGRFGLEAMGANGAALATTAARWFMAVSLLLYVLNMRHRDTYGVRSLAGIGWRAGARQRNVGYASGLSVGIESLAFAILNIFAGWIGAIELAAYHLTFNLLAFFFMIAIGLGAATAVRVGIAHGRGDAPDMTLAGWTGLGAVLMVTLCAGVAMRVLNVELADLYSTNPALLMVAASYITVAALVLVTDGAQAVMANALRGRQDVWIPSALQTFSFFGVMVPAGYVFAFWLDWGGIGLFAAVLLAVSVSTLLLCVRFQWLAMRDMRQPAVAAG